jgi:hypothetical protein
MLWTKEQLPLHIRSKPEHILKAGLLVANAALSKGLSEDEATFVCLQKIKSLESRLKPKLEPRVVPSHIAQLLKRNIPVNALNLFEMNPEISELDNQDNFSDLQKKLSKKLTKLQSDFNSFRKNVEDVPVYNTVVRAPTRILSMDDIEQGTNPTQGDILSWSKEKDKFELTKNFQVGDIVLSSANKALDSKWLLADGSTYLQDDYPELFSVVGLARLSPNTKLVTPAVTPTVSATGAAISGDGLYFAVGSGELPFIMIYKQTGATYTLLPAPSSLPTGTVSGCSMSGDGVRLTVTTGSPDYVHNYKRTNDTFTKLPSPATLPIVSSSSSAYSYDGNYMAASYGQFTK